MYKNPVNYINRINVGQRIIINNILKRNEIRLLQGIIKRL